MVEPNEPFWAETWQINRLPQWLTKTNNPSYFLRLSAFKIRHDVITVLAKQRRNEHNSRGRRRTEERVFLEGLKRESAQKRSKARSGNGTLRTIVFIHGDNEQGHVGHHECRNQPREPPLERHGVAVRRKRPLGRDSGCTRRPRMDSVVVPTPRMRFYFSTRRRWCWWVPPIHPPFDEIWPKIGTF